MKSVKNRILSVVLCVLLLESMLCGGYAETDSINALPINRLLVTITLSGSNLTGSGICTMASGYTANLSIVVQHKTTSGSWDTVALAAEANAREIYITHTLSSGEYRIKVRAKVYDPNGVYVETLTKCSSVVSI